MEPVWDEQFLIPVCHRASSLLLDVSTLYKIGFLNTLFLPPRLPPSSLLSQVRDKDHAWSEAIGSVSLPTQPLLEGQVSPGSGLTSPAGGGGLLPHPRHPGEGGGQEGRALQCPQNGQLEVSARLGTCSGQEYGIDSYFQQRQGCRWGRAASSPPAQRLALLLCEELCRAGAAELWGGIQSGVLLPRHLQDHRGCQVGLRLLPLLLVHPGSLCTSLAGRCGPDSIWSGGRTTADCRLRRRGRAGLLVLVLTCVQSGATYLCALVEATIIALI